MLCGKDITVIDSMVTSIGLCYIVGTAARATLASLPKNEVLRVINYVINQMTFTPGVLEKLIEEVDQ